MNAANRVHAHVQAQIAGLPEPRDLLMLDRDPELVHRFRVRLRRLRSLLRTYRSLYPSDPLDVREDVRELAGLLGQLRDADVMEANLRKMAQDPSSELLRDIVEGRAAAYRAVLPGWAGQPPRYEALRMRLGRLKRDPKARPRDVKQDADRTWRHLERRIRASGPDASATDLHRLRILVKRTRYATGAIAKGKPGPFVHRLEEAQDLLGAHHDQIVLAVWLTERRTVPGSGILAEEATTLAAEIAAGWSPLRDRLLDASPPWTQRSAS